ncbi:hypothetical protein Vafri_19974 [Volvox africanus]|nr:hypothetical protein Vafri_19974 [Volvox africanus]
MAPQITVRLATRGDRSCTPPRPSALHCQHVGHMQRLPWCLDEIEPLNLLINCRDKSKRARCPLIALTNDDDAPEVSMRREIFLGEPCNIYRLPSGDWWLEYYRYFTFDDVTVMATAAGRPAKLPNDYDNLRELLRDTEPSHCRCAAPSFLATERQPLTIFDSVMAHFRRQGEPSAWQHGHRAHQKGAAV